MEGFNELLKEISTSIKELAETSLNELKNQLITAGEEFVQDTQEELKLWTLQLAAGEISLSDFEWLLKSKKDLIELTLLKQKGLTEAKIDKFTNGLFNVIVLVAGKRVKDAQRANGEW